MINSIGHKPRRGGIMVARMEQSAMRVIESNYVCVLAGFFLKIMTKLKELNIKTQN